MIQPYRAAFALLLALAVAGCGGDSPARPVGRLLTTDSSSYTLVPIGNGLGRVRVATTYANHTATDAGLERCDQRLPYPIYDLELLAPRDTEGSAYAVAWACVGGVPPFVVPAGGTRVDTITLTGPATYDNARQRYTGALEGTFTLSYGGATSNAFAIKLPPGGLVPYVPRDLSAAIQTDSLLVHLRYGDNTYVATAPIHVTIYNPLRDTLFLSNCQGETAPTLEKRDAGVWVPVWQGIMSGCYTPPIAIAPGDHYALSVNFIAGRKGSSIAPQLQVEDVPGVYRLVWNGLGPSRAAPSSPVDSHVSNDFAVVVDR